MVRRCLRYRNVVLKCKYFYLKWRGREQKKITKLFLIAALLVVAQICYAQTIPPDRVLRDSIDVTLLRAEQKLKSNLNESDSLSRWAKKFSTQIDYKFGVAKSIYTLGKIYFVRNENEKSLHAFLHSEQLFQELKDKTNQGLSQNGIGSIYFQKLGNYNKALEHYLKARDLLAADSSFLIRVLVNIGSIYNKTERYEAALTLYTKVYQFASKNNDSALMGISLHNIGSLYGRTKNFELSIKYNLLSIQFHETLSDYYHLVSSYANLGLAYTESNRLKEGKKVLERALYLSQRHSFKDLEIDILLNHSKLQEHYGDFQSSENLILQAEKIANDNAIDSRNKDIYQRLSTVNKRLGNLEKALYYNEKYATLADSIVKLERSAIQVQENVKGNYSLTQLPYSLILVIATIIIAGGAFWLIRGTIAEKSKNNSGGSDMKKGTPELLASQQEQLGLHHLEVINGEGLKILQLDNIWWLQKEGRYYNAYTETHHYRMKDNISEIEPLLPQTKFFRINRTTIVNTTRINNYSFWQNHKYIIRMADLNKSEFIISRKRLREMKLIFNVMHAQ